MSQSKIWTGDMALAVRLSSEDLSCERYLLSSNKVTLVLSLLKTEQNRKKTKQQQNQYPSVLNILWKGLTEMSV